MAYLARRYRRRSETTRNSRHHEPRHEAIPWPTPMLSVPRIGLWAFECAW